MKDTIIAILFFATLQYNVASSEDVSHTEIYLLVERPDFSTNGSVPGLPKFNNPYANCTPRLTFDSKNGNGYCSEHPTKLSFNEDWAPVVSDRMFTFKLVCNSTDQWTWKYNQTNRWDYNLDNYNTSDTNLPHASVLHIRKPRGQYTGFDEISTIATCLPTATESEAEDQGVSVKISPWLEIR